MLFHKQCKEMNIQNHVERKRERERYREREKKKERGSKGSTKAVCDTITTYIIKPPILSLHGRHTCTTEMT
jgi:hypothetical protein